MHSHGQCPGGLLIDLALLSASAGVHTLDFIVGQNELQDKMSAGSRLGILVRQCPLGSGAAVPTAIWSSRLRSGSALRSVARSPAVPTPIWSSRLKPGSAHCDLGLAVEVRQCPLRSGAVDEAEEEEEKEKAEAEAGDGQLSQWALPDFNRELQIAVGTAGLDLPAPDPSGHCRASTASSRSQWALPDFICQLQIAVGTAGLQSRLPDRSGHCRTSTASPRWQWALPDSTASPGSQWAPPDFNREPQILVGTAGLEPGLPDRSGHCRISTCIHCVHARLIARKNGR
eukprot:s4094_g1.t1